MNFSKICALFVATTLLAGCGSSNSTHAASESAKASESAIPDFCADSAYAYVATQCNFGARVPNTEAHEACGKWIEAQLSAWCDTVIAQRCNLTAFDHTTLRATNYIGIINPAAETRILLLAHWDCRPWADNDPDESKRATAVMGANDAASGVGVLLEIARLTAQQKPEVGIDLLMVDAEDWGESSNDESWALGTQYWVTHPHTSGYKPSFGILLDMVGAKEALFHKEGFSCHYAQGIVDALWNVAAEGGFSQFQNTQHGFVTDDHVVVNRAGIPCIDIIDMRPESDSGFFSHWHTTTDTMEQIDPATLKAVGQTLINFIFSK